MKGPYWGGPFFDCEPDIQKVLLSGKCQKLKTTAKWLEEKLVPELRKRNFSGDFGVDAFVYRDSESNFKNSSVR